jgi:hypothetical protein
MKKSILIHPDELSKVWIDRMVRENIDVIALHPPGGNKAHEYLAKMLEMLEAPEYRALLDYAAEQGLKIEYEMHAAGYLLSKDLFASHPEYFRMNEKGERVVFAPCPIKIWQGDADETVDPVFVKEYVESVRRSGSFIEFHLLKGVGHKISPIMREELLMWFNRFI